MSIRPGAILSNSVLKKISTSREVARFVGSGSQLRDGKQVNIFSKARLKRLFFTQKIGSSRTTYRGLFAEPHPRDDRNSAKH